MLMLYHMLFPTAHALTVILTKTSQHQGSLSENSGMFVQFQDSAIDGEFI